MTGRISCAILILEEMRMKTTAVRRRTGVLYMRVLLDICLQKDVNTFLYESLPLCVIRSQPYLYEWFLQHYMELYLVDAKKDDRYNFYAVRYAETTSYLQYSNQKEVLIYNQVESAVINNKLNIVDYIKAQINHGVYAIVFLNEWAIPHKRSYHKDHWYHESLVYGYDDGLGVVYCISFDQNRNFTAFEVNYHSFWDGFQLICNDPSDITPFQRYLYLLKPRDMEYRFDIKRFVRQLDNLLCGELDLIDKYNLDLLDYPTPREDWKYHFGMQIPGRFADIIQNKYKDKAQIPYLDFHILMESKRLMAVRLAYLNEHYMRKQEMEGLVEQYKRVADAYDVARNLYLKLEHLRKCGEKSEYTEDGGLLVDKIVQILESAANKETEILKQVRRLAAAVAQAG